MKTYSFYDSITGLFLSRYFDGSWEMLQNNTPDGAIAIEGQYDSLSQRFDFASKSVVPWKPPAPQNTELTSYKWNEQTNRWVGTPTPAAKSIEVKAKRTALLSASDWTQLADTELTSSQQAAWKIYRKALRDLPTKPGFPETVVWPIPPDS